MTWLIHKQLVLGTGFSEIWSRGKTHVCVSLYIFLFLRCAINSDQKHVAFRVEERVTQGIGSTANFKSRLANYKSHIKHKRRTCSITNHFIDMNEADYSSLKFMLIDQHHSEILKSKTFG